MKKYLDIKNIIILVLFASTAIIAINPKGIMPNRTKYHEIIDSIPYAVHDTITVDSLVEVGYEVPVEVKIPYAVHDTVPTPVDTANILKIFYVKNLIKEDLKLPNNQGTITLNQTVTENKIVSTEFKANITPKVKKDTIFLPEPKKNQVYFGIVTGVSDRNVISNVGLGFLYKTKEDKIFKVTTGVANRLQADVTGTFFPYVEGGVYWKIKTKKSY